ncbi:hypothetical protein NL676_021535 [Syzygium grande]|nr:hypothetical protein NL676_021535 [Syzygium grande]
MDLTGVVDGTMKELLTFEDKLLEALDASKQWMINSVSHDVLLLENQVPFFVLENLHNLTALRTTITFFKLNYEYFEDVLPGHELASTRVQAKKFELTRSAKELHEAGIKFRWAKGTSAGGVGVERIPSSSRDAGWGRHVKKDESSLVGLKTSPRKLHWGGRKIRAFHCAGQMFDEMRRWARYGNLVLEKVLMSIVNRRFIAQTQYFSKDADARLDEGESFLVVLQISLSKVDAKVKKREDPSIFRNAGQMFDKMPS